MEDRTRILEAALEAAANAIVITDTKGSILWVNNAFTRQTGYERQDVLGQNPRLLKSGRQDPAFYTDLWQAITSGRVWRGVLLNRRKDGGEYPEEMTITPVRGEGGDITHFIAIKEDITDRRRAEEAMLEKEKLESIGALAAGIAHDFNNLLTVVLGHTALAVHQLGRNHPVGSQLQRAMEATEKAADITRQLLAYARKGQYKQENLDINGLLRENQRQIATLLGTNIRLSLDLAPDVPIVSADPVRVRQVLFDLVVNARDAIQEIRADRSNSQDCAVTIATGSRAITPDSDLTGYQANAVPAPGLYASLRISDTGPGMDPDIVTRIFDPFFSTKFVGRGLGLAAVLGIVLVHRGGLQVVSEPGKGTAFTVLLPAESADDRTQAREPGCWQEARGESRSTPASLTKP
ncbi:MAG: PAS domain S-box protein [Acidobacteria bacterium]|nr:PAS domain S-box protein [Acidobacteriota bacterium]